MSRSQHVLFLLPVFLLTACSGGVSGDATVTETVTVGADGTTIAATATSGKAAPQDERGTVNQDMQNGSIKLRVDKVEEPDPFMLVADGYQPGFKPDEAQTPRDGGKFVTVTTTVENTGKETIDLTCGLGVQVVAATEDDSNYEPIRELYRIPGNPECNDMLGAGFPTQMTWAFEIPTSKTVTTFGFADPRADYGHFTPIDVS